MNPSDGRLDLRKDLQDFEDLSRAPVVAFLQKQVVPNAPRDKAAGRQPSVFQKLGIFLPTNLCRWLSEYFRYRIGRKHPFLCYNDRELDDGVYSLEGGRTGDADEIRVALAGDWGTGTDEA